MTDAEVLSRAVEILHSRAERLTRLRAKGAAAKSGQPALIFACEVFLELEAARTESLASELAEMCSPPPALAS